MTFEQLVDAIDASLGQAAGVSYGLYRGPTVAYWHLGDRTARLRAGEHGDVLLDGPFGLSVRAACDDSALEPIVTALAPWLTGR